MLTLLRTTTVGTVKLSAAEKFDPNVNTSCRSRTASPPITGYVMLVPCPVLIWGVAEVVRLQKTQNSYEFGYPQIKTGRATRTVQHARLWSSRPEGDEGLVGFIVKEKGRYPEFNGNVKAVDTRELWREADVSPVNQGYHYNHNAETYYETGERLGRAMAALLESTK